MKYRILILLREFKRKNSKTELKELTIQMLITFTLTEILIVF